MHLRNPSADRIRRGQAILEMGVLLAFLTLLFLGLVDVGFLFDRALRLENAARQGLRLAVTGCSEADIVASIQSAAIGLNVSNLSWDITPVVGDPEWEPGAVVTVQVWYTTRPPLKLPGIFNDPLTITIRHKGKIL